jgi:hypothetical protein
MISHLRSQGPKRIALTQFNKEVAAFGAHSQNSGEKGRGLANLGIPGKIRYNSIGVKWDCRPLGADRILSAGFSDLRAPPKISH